ncbi:bifunctional metallophosphatase/5'-nucleotidase [Paucibacter sp. Y2R2-4]|uniref:bifunctional metallophosphatase/5'-nucleotidase n=1 Tax=Paucibacter sp. Y2R2-4 TaxID=2893553 RepID=UPI0021E3ADF4|nr:bifunctional metallophosphatase/5'-nucleotidase [Paucibacter sp. Y2R2-4]MCV2349383.1 bifunctional metallophosphatase/5'-nucleotidase [Paucibacter sp. Y2R2-4]
MLKLNPLLLALSAAFCLSTPASAQTPAPAIKVKIIGFNDFHGTLESPGTFGVNTSVPAANRPLVGGAEYLAAYVADMKSKNPNTVVVGAGDFVGATPLISSLFFDEPAVEALNKIGVDFSSVGNHEFDKGKDELRRLQMGGCKLVAGQPDPNSCKGFGSSAPGTFDGAKFKWLSANVIDTGTGRSLLPPYGVKSFGGVRVAFIGMTLKGTPDIVTPTGVAGLSFKDEADTVNAIVPVLRAQGIESIVVLVHQGAFQNPAVAGGFNNQDINGCLNNLKNSDGSDSDLGKIVARLDNAVDLVVSGHTHAAYNCSKTTVDNGNSPRTAGLPNKTGRLVPVTSASAFGRVLSEIDLSIDPKTRDVVDVSVNNRLVDRNNATANQLIASNPTVKNLVSSYLNAVSPLANQVVGTLTADLSNAANAAGEMPAGDLIADAQLQATQPAQLGGAVMAFMNAGGVRSPGFVKPAGATAPFDISYGNAFTVQPFGNSLVTMTLTAQQIKDVLEQQFKGCKGQGTTRIMQISNGLQYSWSDAAPACAKIVDVNFTPTDVTVYPPVATGAVDKLVIAGVVQNPNKTYRVTVNNFMATGGDGYTTLVGGSNVLGGAQDIDALIAYLAGYKGSASAYDPSQAALKKPRINKLP